MSVKKIREDMEKLKTLERSREAIKENQELRNRVVEQSTEINLLRLRHDMLEDLLNEMGHKGFPSPEIRFRPWTDSPPDEALVEERNARRDAIIYSELVKNLKQYPNVKPELKTELDRLVNVNVNRILGNPSEWPEQLKQRTQKEVDEGIKQRLNQEFYTEVEARVQPELQRQLKEVWPGFINNWVTQHFQILLGNQLRKLCISLEVACDQCKTPGSVTITQDVMAYMLVEGNFRFMCVNPRCLDFRRRHEFSVTLGQVIIEVMKRTPKTPLYATPIITAYPVNETKDESPGDYEQDQLKNELNEEENEKRNKL